MAKLFKLKYTKYNLGADMDTKTLHIAASTFHRALEKAEKIVKSDWADRVVSLEEESEIA